MAQVVVTMKIMPDGVDVDLTPIETEAKQAILAFGGEVGKVDIEPIAFGLKALNLIFVMDEAKGATDELEDQVRNIEGVNSVEITDVRRAIG